MFFMITGQIVVRLCKVLRWTLQDTGMCREKSLCQEETLIVFAMWTLCCKQRLFLVVALT
jgi:hypothetical protein